jgi:hypothetical protein
MIIDWRLPVVYMSLRNGIQPGSRQNDGEEATSDRILSGDRCGWGCAQAAPGTETIDKTKLEWAHAILRDAHDAVKKHYYDPAYHGLDLKRSTGSTTKKLIARQALTSAFAWWPRF